MEIEETEEGLGVHDFSRLTVKDGRLLLVSVKP